MVTVQTEVGGRLVDSIVQCRTTCYMLHVTCYMLLL